MKRPAPRAYSGFGRARPEPGIIEIDGALGALWESDMDEILEVSSETIAGYPVVRAVGEIDVSSAPQLRERLNEVASGSKALVVDLTKVTFLDSTGIGVLVGALKRLQSSEPDGELRLVVASSHILKVLEVTGLTSIFKVCPTLDEATR